MPNPLQIAAMKAAPQLPYSIASKKLPINVRPGSLAGGYSTGRPSIASTEASNPFAPITVENQQVWTNPDNTPQLLRHEMSHQVQKQWAPKILQSLPPVNPNDPYGGTDTADLKRIGGDPKKLSVEQSAAVEQKMQAMEQNGEKIDPIYQTFDRKFGEVPLSIMQPTDPNQKGINTMPRDPGLPPNQPWLLGKLHAHNVIPVKPGSGQSDDPYASIAQSTASDSSDPYAGIATPTQAVPPTDTRNGLQKAVDTAATPDSASVRAKQTPLENGLSAFGKSFTRGVIQPLVHPIKTAEGMGSFSNFEHPESYAMGTKKPDLIDSTVQDYRNNGPAVGTGDLLGTGAAMLTGAGTASAVGDAVIPKMAAGLKFAAPRIADTALGTVPDAYGGNPGMAVAREKISGFSPQRVLARTKAAIPDVSAEHKGILAGYQGAPIDIGNEVADPFRGIREAKTDPLTGTAKIPQITALNKTQTQLLHVPDEFTGKPTMAMRPLNQYSPLDANKLKSNIYQMTDYDNPFKNSLANDALKQSAHGIKNKIAEAVPESAESGERLHNLMSLKDLMERKSPEGVPASKSAFMSNILRKGGTSLAGGMYGFGSGGSLPSLQKLVPALGAVGTSRKR